MKSVLLISFSEASSPKSKEVNYRTVGEKKMQIPRLMIFPSGKNGQVDIKTKYVEVIGSETTLEGSYNTAIVHSLPPFHQQLQIT